MLTNIYVIDYVLKNLDGDKEQLDRIFGTEPLWIHPDMTPGQSIVATYYQLPGNGEMMHALGMFQEGGDSIRVEHDRLFLIGIMCDDIDKTMTEISGRGLKFVHDEPKRYAVGESNTLGTLNGVEIFIARHIPDGDKIGREMMFTKDGSSNFGDETQGGLFQGVSGLDFAVVDLNGALDTFRAVFGVEPAETTAQTAAAGVKSWHFPAPGGGKGLRDVGFFSLDNSGAKSPLADRIAAFLARHGDGIFRMNLLVANLPAMRALLASRDIHLPQHEPVLADICGTDLRYVTNAQ